MSPVLGGVFFTTEPPGKPTYDSTDRQWERMRLSFKLLIHSIHLPQHHHFGAFSIEFIDWNQAETRDQSQSRDKVSVWSKGEFKFFHKVLMERPE